MPLAGQFLVLYLGFAAIVIAAKQLPSSSNFVHTQCNDLQQIYRPLIDDQLAAYRDGLSVNDILKLQGPADPVALLYNNTLMARQAPVLNMAAYWVPLVKELARKVSLPDFVLAGDVWDLPEDEAKQGGPWFGFCNVLFMTANLLLPAGPGLVSALRCGRKCQPFTDSDHRFPKAIFLGSSTGWIHARRNAVVLAGMLHKDTVYSGYTQMIDLPAGGVPEEQAGLATLKPNVDLAEQIKKYKYIIVADGHCAALRMRHVLASDSAVFWVETNLIEWFYPLLQPYVHYIPVRLLRHEPQDPLQDINDKVAWAESNPDKVAKIVKNANQFAVMHLSEHALTCYSVQMLDEYARLFQDPQLLPGVATEGAFSAEYTNYTR